jgi:predicted Ser/Thr protein kinase
MGEVYKARQTRLDRLVALKILPAEAARSPGFPERFQREAQALARLSHPHVVGIYDFGDTDGLFYFLMEFVDGGNLRQLVRQGPCPPRRALQIVSEVCAALEYAHEEGVVHRDIKPENILLDRRGRVKIADFGLAKLLGPAAAGAPLTVSAQVMGTWNYMAPEQIESPLQVDHRADIYSVGVVLYELLTGHLPRGRFAPPSYEILADPRLDAVVLRALEPEPGRRYQNIGEMRRDFEGLGAAPRAEAPRPGGEAPPAGRASEPPTEKVGAPIREADQWSAAEAVRRRTRDLARGLRATGLLIWFLSWVIPLAFLALHGPTRSGVLEALFAWTFLAGMAQAAALTYGISKLAALDGYGLVNGSIVLAMLPFTPGFLLALPVGIWALGILRDPQVKAAFRENRAPGGTTGYGNRVIRTREQDIGAVGASPPGGVQPPAQGTLAAGVARAGETTAEWVGKPAGGVEQQPESDAVRRRIQGPARALLVMGIVVLTFWGAMLLLALLALLVRTLVGP